MEWNTGHTASKESLFLHNSVMKCLPMNKYIVSNLYNHNILETIQCSVLIIFRILISSILLKERDISIAIPKIFISLHYQISKSVPMIMCEMWKKNILYYHKICPFLCFNVYSAITNLKVKTTLFPVLPYKK